MHILLGTLIGSSAQSYFNPKELDEQSHTLSFQVPIKNRKQELQELLLEHAQIIQEVQDMETKVDTPGADKENKTFSTTNKDEENWD